MKIRGDFVSNSSSSSFIVTTAKKQNELFGFIVSNTHDKSSEYWHSNLDKNNMEFLQEHFNKYVQLVIGNFTIINDRRASWSLEDSEEDTEECFSLENCVVDADDIGKFIKNGKVNANSYEDFLVKGKYPDRYYMSYNVFEITQDSIDFTRWLLGQCATKETSPELKAFDDYLCENKVIERQYAGEDVPKEVIEEAEKLKARCFGLLLAPEATRYVNGKGECYPLSELLDEYEKRLKEGKRIYRFCAGYSGEGTDWDDYIWTDKCLFSGVDNGDYKFEHDMWW